MRKIFVILMAYSLLTVPAFARTGNFPSVHTFEIGTEIYFMEYEEPGIMENDGLMYGLTGSYTYRKAVMGRIEARLATGEVDYSSVRTGSSDDITDTAFEIRGLFGLDFSLRSWLITPYIGFGYRYLNDDSEGTITTTGHFGYERESNYYYSPIGVEAIIPLKNLWYLGLNAEYDFFWSGEQKSRLSTFPGLNDLDNDQDDGHGARASLWFHKDFTDLSLKFGTFFRYWKIDDSEVSPLLLSGVLLGYGFEPENETYEAGAQFSLRF